MSQPAPGRARQARTIRLIRPADRDGLAVFCITLGSHATYYVAREISCEIGGRGFAVHRLGLGALYHVRVGEAQDCSCECKGFLRWGYCRHILGLLALIREARL